MVDRNSAIQFQLEGGTGPILLACSIGDFMEVYKEDICFEVQSPEAIDPDKKDMSTPWTIRKRTEFGAANIFAARTVLQANKILQSTILSEAKKISILSRLGEVRDNLIEGDKLATELRDKATDIASNFKLNRKRRVQSDFPSFPKLKESVGRFLILQKRTLQCIGDIIDLFFDTGITGHHYHKIVKWLEINLNESPVHKVIRDNLDFVEWVIDMRNYYEHPAQKKTEIRDFHWDPEKNSIHYPTWNISGEQKTSIVEDSIRINAIILDLAEAVIVFSAFEKTPPIPFQVVAIDPVDPKIPIRYSLEISISAPNKE